MNMMLSYSIMTKMDIKNPFSRMYFSREGFMTHFVKKIGSLVFASIVYGRE
jgi:hypothetical protein